MNFHSQYRGKTLSILIFVFASLLVLINFKQVSAAPASKAQEMAPVEIVWDKLPNAAKYELEFVGASGKSIKIFKSPNNIFKMKMKVGKYKIRARYFDKENRKSPWSELSEFVVEPEPVQLKEENAFKTTTNSKRPFGIVQLAWPPSPNAESYQINVFDRDQKVVKDFTVKTNKANFKLPPGIYTYNITVIGHNNIKSVPAKYSPEINIDAGQTAMPEFVMDENNQLKMKSDGDARIQGQLEYSSIIDEDWYAIEDFEEIKDGFLPLNPQWKPGKYRIWIWAVAPGLKPSEKISKDFVIKPQEKDIETYLE